MPLQSRGSPSYQYGLAPTNFITAVNGVETRDLDSFVREVNKIPDNTYFRLRAVTFDNVPWVVTMKKNDHYVRIPNLEPVLSISITDTLAVPHVRIHQRPICPRGMEDRLI